METIEVTNKQDFDFNMKKILSKYRHERLVFRGQVKDYPLVPSMYRGRGGFGCIPKLTTNWGVCAKRLIARFKKTVSSQIEIEAIMQHYGYRSFFVDVTFDPEVALWFALHKFESKRTPLYVDKQLRSAIFQWSKYRPSNRGYLYVILLPSKNESNNRCLKLTSVMPKDAQRVHRQTAGAVFCSRESRSVNDLVVSKLRVVDDGWFINSNQNVKTTEFFPPPSIDVFYRCLCNIPYFITFEDAKEKIEFGHPLLGFLPIYAESIKEVVKEYVPLTRILGPAKLGLEWNVSTSVLDFEDKLVKARGATRVLLSSLMIQTISNKVQVSEGFRNDCWPSSNLLLEFEPEASLVSPSPKTPQEIVRGMWVIIGRRSIMVAQIIDQFDKVLVGHEYIYSLPEFKVISKRCDCPDHTYELELLRKTSELLNKGTVYLEKGELGYLKLEYKEATKGEGKRKDQENR